MTMINHKLTFSLTSRGEAAKQARQASELKQADLRLNDWKQDANIVLTAVGSALNNIAAEEKLDRKWPRSFFA
jgi:hypothetical protein